MSLWQSEIHCAGWEPGQPGWSPPALGQLLLVRWMTPATQLESKPLYSPPPSKRGWGGVGVVTLLLYKQPRNSLDFAFWPTEPKIFTICAFIEKNLSTSILDRYLSYHQYREMHRNGVILPDVILRQEDKSTAISLKDQGNGLGQNRPCRLKNKGPGGLSPRD